MRLAQGKRGEVGQVEEGESEETAERDGLRGSPIKWRGKEEGRG